MSISTRSTKAVTRRCCGQPEPNWPPSELWLPPVQMSTRLTTTAPHQCALRRTTRTRIRFLIAAGADINKSDVYGITPVLAAAGNKNEKVIGALIAAGADIHDVDKYGATPARDAVMATVRSL